MKTIYYDTFRGLLPVRVLDVWRDNGPIKALYTEVQVAKALPPYKKGERLEVTPLFLVELIPVQGRYGPSKIKTVDVSEYWDNPIRLRWQNLSTGQWVDCNDQEEPQP